MKIFSKILFLYLIINCKANKIPLVVNTWKFTEATASGKFYFIYFLNSVNVMTNNKILNNSFTTT